MANTLTWSNLNTLFTTTGPAYLRGKLEDIYFDSHPFFDKIRGNGGIEDQKEPGQKLVLKLRIGYNTTVKAASTRSNVDIAENETVTTAQWPWGSLTGSISIYDEDLHDNMSQAQLVPILEPAMDQIADTWADLMSKQIIQQTSADSPFNFLGLKDGVTDGTYSHPADYGGLTTSNYSTWKANMVDNTADLGLLVDKMNHCYNLCTYGVNQPDFLLTDQLGEELYRSAMDTNIRYTDVKSGDGTINVVTFRGKPVMFDRAVTSITSNPTGWSGTPDTASTHRIYMLNTKTWMFNFDAKWNLSNSIEQQWRVPTNSFSRVKLVAIRGQLVTKQRRYNGCLINVPES